ncbi:MAG: phage virion morphogenesis protein [Nitrospirota bacterium]
MIKISVKDKEALRFLTELQRRSTNMTPVMRRIAEIMHDAVEENFEAEGRPRWRPLAASTIMGAFGGARKWNTKKGAVRKSIAKKLAGRKILQDSGQLAASISRKSDARSARVGTNKVYAAIHQFGGKAGRGRKVTIPARPFLKLTDSDIEEIKEAIKEYLKPHQ